MDYNKFESLLKKAVKESFSTIIKNNNIYSFAIITSEFTDSIIAVANTREYMKNCKKEYEDTPLDCKYLIAEWDYGIETNNKEFENLNEILFNEIFIEKSKEEHLSFESKIFEICLNTLRELRNENFFKNLIKKEIFIMFESMDGSFSKTKLKKIVSSLNDNKYKKEYFEWLASID